MTPTVGQTENFVRRLFAGVTDKGGNPYAEHCIRGMLGDEGLPVDDLHAALLHDVIEDTPTTAANLRGLGYSERTVKLVERLTRPKGVPYADYVRGIAESGDAGLIAIKRADLADNSDHARLARLPEADRNRLTAKYAEARKILDDRWT